MPSLKCPAVSFPKVEQLIYPIWPSRSWVVVAATTTVARIKSVEYNSPSLLYVMETVVPSSPRIHSAAVSRSTGSRACPSTERIRSPAFRPPREAGESSSTCSIIRPSGPIGPPLRENTTPIPTRLESDILVRKAAYSSGVKYSV